MKNPFETIDVIDRKIETAVKSEKKQSKIRYLVYGIAVLSACMSIYFTSTAMSQSAPLPIAILMAISISGYIDIAPQVASRIFASGKHGLVAFILYVSLTIPILYSMSTTIQTMYTMQSVKIELARTKIDEMKQKEDQRLNAIAERERLTTLLNKYNEEILQETVGTYKERTLRQRIIELEGKINDIDSISNTVIDYKRKDFYTFISDTIGMKGDMLELLMMVVPAVFIDLIAPILLSVVILL